MSRKASETSGVSRSSGAKTEPRKDGPLPGTYYGNSRDCNTDRFQKDGQRGGGETRKGK